MVRCMVGIFFILFFFMSGCDRKGESTVPDQLPMDIPVVDVVLVRKIQQREEYDASGIIAPFQAVTINSRLSGTVATLFVDKGSQVKKGDLLLKLDDEILKLRKEEKETQYKKSTVLKKDAMIEFNRKNTLFKKSTVSKTEVDKAALQFNEAELNEKLAEISLGLVVKDYTDTTIRAPIDGMITDTYAETGEMVSAGTPLIHLIDYSRVRLEVGFSEKEIVHITKGSKARITIDALPDDQFDVLTPYRGVSSDTATGVFPVEYVIHNPDKRILPGMIGRVSVRNPSGTSSLFVPQSSVSKRFGDSSVFVENQGKIYKRDVQPGILFKGYREILQGLKEGEKVVVIASDRLKDGMSVNMQLAIDE